jgi:Ca2+:H+ antiporter
MEEGSPPPRKVEAVLDTPRRRVPRLGALAILAPLAWAAGHAGIPALAFPLSILALIAGAFLLGEAAEVVASRVGDGLGSLVTATLSNLVTLTIVGAALLNGLYEVVQASVVGAILGNILFALGGAMLVGGWGRERQTFGKEAAATNATLLLVSAFALMIPAVVGRLVGDADPQISEKLTIPVVIILFMTYVIGLLFSVKTHRHLFNPESTGEHRLGPVFFERMPLIALSGSVLLVAVMAETLANSIAPVGESMGLSPFFLGIVVIGVITNSVEIAAAWRFARQDRMNVTIQIATGSGIQVMLFVVPVLVLVSTLLPTGILSLEFAMSMVLAVGFAAMLVNVVASDGESTWYEGVLLLALFAIIGIVFYFHP